MEVLSDKGKMEMERGNRGQTKCIILTDSNGREATSDSIKNHMPRDMRNSHDIQVVPAYTTEEAFIRVGNGDIDVRNAYVIVDLLTNDIRGTRHRPAVSPEELRWRVDRLRARLREAGAVASVICQAKPMEVADVRPYNSLLHKYLQAQRGSGHGCLTQIRRNYLRRDGYHVQEQYASIIDRTYACVILGWPVPSPTPLEDFIPTYVRRSYDAEWPGLARRNGWTQRIGYEGPRTNYGW